MAGIMDHKPRKIINRPQRKASGLNGVYRKKQ